VEEVVKTAIGKLPLAMPMISWRESVGKATESTANAAGEAR